MASYKLQKGARVKVLAKRGSAAERPEVGTVGQVIARRSIFRDESNQDVNEYLVRFSGALEIWNYEEFELELINV